MAILPYSSECLLSFIADDVFRQEVNQSSAYLREATTCVASPDQGMLQAVPWRFHPTQLVGESADPCTNRECGTDVFRRVIPYQRTAMLCLRLCWHHGVGADELNSMLSACYLSQQERELSRLPLVFDEEDVMMSCEATHLPLSR